MSDLARYDVWITPYAPGQPEAWSTLVPWITAAEVGSLAAKMQPGDCMLVGRTHEDAREGSEY
jgi:hypothetical protein